MDAGAPPEAAVGNQNPAVDILPSHGEKAGEREEGSKVREVGQKAKVNGPEGEEKPVEERGPACSTRMKAYFDELQKDVDMCYAIANEARAKGHDPEVTVEIPQAKDLAARVEELVGPKDVARRIREVARKIGNRESLR